MAKHDSRTPTAKLRHELRALVDAHGYDKVLKQLHNERPTLGGHLGTLLTPRERAALNLADQAIARRARAVGLTVTVRQTPQHPCPSCEAAYGARHKPGCLL
jgi:hypothetical protein